jgi:hypothetical protein
VTTFSVVTRADPEVAYAFVADGSAVNHPRWDAGIVRVDLAGPVVPGARGSEVRRFLGRESTIRFAVLAAERPARLVLREEPGTWNLTRTYRFEPAPGGGTRLSLDFDMTPRARVFRVLFPALRPLIHRQVRATVDRLGAVLGPQVTPRSRRRDGAQRGR